MYSLAYRVVELIFKDEYTLTNFFVNVTMDMAKLAVGIKITAALTSGLVTSALATGGSVIVIALGVFAVGLAVGFILYKLDDEFKISETIIKMLKSHRPLKPETPHHPDQFFSNWHMYSRG